MASTYLSWELLDGLLRSWRSQRRCMMGQFAEQGSGSSCSGSHSPAETEWSVGTAWRRSQTGHPGEWPHRSCYKPWSSSWGAGPGLESWSLGFYQRHHARHTQDPCTWLQQKWGLVAQPGGLQKRWKGRTRLFLCSDDFIPSNNLDLHLHFIFHSKHSDTQSPWTFISISMNSPANSQGSYCPSCFGIWLLYKITACFCSEEFSLGVFFQAALRFQIWHA